MTVSEHLQNAIDELKSARDEAGIGTGLMIGGAIEKVRDIKSRYDNINDNERES
jgi:hypothetical protein